MPPSGTDGSRNSTPVNSAKSERSGSALRAISLNVSLLKLAFTHMAAARCFEDGRFNDMRMPAMATQIAPVFRQIAKTLEGTW